MGLSACVRAIAVSGSMTETFGSYELLDLLGQGGMGQVYRARKMGAKVDVAVKFLRSELISDEQMIARFLQERSLMVSLRHENLVNVQDLVVEDGRAAIVMEYVGGGDVRAVIESDGAQSPAFVVATMTGVFAALEYVHAQGVIHRDIKPENILLGAHREPKVSDFGIARLTEGQRITKVTSIVGTPEYIAPEMAESDEVTPAIDVYAAGIMMFEMLTGKTPFAGGHPVAVLRRHIEMDVPRIPGLDDRIQSILGSLLLKDPRQRASAKEARDRLLLMGSAVTTIPVVEHLAATDVRTSSETAIVAKAAPTPTPTETVIVASSVLKQESIEQKAPLGNDADEERVKRKRLVVLLSSVGVVVALSAVGILALSGGHGPVLLQPSITNVNSTTTTKPPSTTTTKPPVTTTTKPPSTTTTKPPVTTTTIAKGPIEPKVFPPAPTANNAVVTGSQVDLQVYVPSGHFITSVKCSAVGSRPSTSKVSSGVANVLFSYASATDANNASGVCESIDRWGRSSYSQTPWP